MCNDCPHTDAYDEGWREGYNDRNVENPYTAGTVEHKEWAEGFKQGSEDC